MHIMHIKTYFASNSSTESANLLCCSILLAVAITVTDMFLPLGADNPDSLRFSVKIEINED